MSTTIFVYFEAGPEVASSGFSFLGWRCGCFSYNKFFLLPVGYFLMSCVLDPL